MRVFVKTFGCSTNLSDGEVIAGCLEDAGYEFAESVSKADLIVYNTCAVKGPTENRIIELLKRVPQHKKVIVAGCLPLINFERLSNEVRFDAAIGPAPGKEIVDVANRVLTGERVILLEPSLGSRRELNLPRQRLNSVIGILPINYGCLGSCTYCCVVHARGELRSYSLNEISREVKKALADGVKEFWVTSQDTACYGRDIGTNLAELLEALVQIEGYFKIRVGMMTPNLMMNIQEDLIRTFENNKLFKFLHLPVQSGANKTLRLMQRFYTVDEFKRIVASFRQRIPEITLATDVICGFPGETQIDFRKTLMLIEETKPDIVNISKFFARPRTTAAEMQNKFVDNVEIKRRTKIASTLAKRVSFERHKKWIGWTGKILIDERGKTPNSWIGRNFAYKPIVIKDLSNLLGSVLPIKITEAYSTFLSGEIVT